MADALSELYLICLRPEALSRTTAAPQPIATIVELVAKNGLYRFEEAMRGAIDNFPVTRALA